MSEVLIDENQNNIFVTTENAPKMHNLVDKKTFASFAITPKFPRREAAPTPIRPSAVHKSASGPGFHNLHIGEARGHWGHLTALKNPAYGYIVVVIILNNSKTE